MNHNVIKWLSKHHIDVADKNVLITGSNSGIGFDTAVILSKLKANIYMCVRNLKRGNEAKDKILKEYQDAKIEILEVDLASFDSIDRFVSYLSDNKIDIDVFINNAGVFNLKNQTTKDGYEIVFGTNYYGTYYLTLKLMPYLFSLNHKVKYIFVGSVASYFSNNDVFSGKKPYESSKYAITAYWYYLASKYADSNVSFHLSHPGITYTSLIDKAYKSNLFVSIARIGMKLLFHDSSIGALATIYQLQDEIKNGTYSGPCFLEIRGFPKKLNVPKRIIRDANDIVFKTSNII